MSELIFPGLMIALVLSVIGLLIWTADGEKRNELECMKRSGMYLEGVCVKGDVIDLGDQHD
jgi:hypothetical protein